MCVGGGNCWYLVIFVYVLSQCFILVPFMYLTWRGCTGVGVGCGCIVDVVGVYTHTHTTHTHTHTGAYTWLPSDDPVPGEFFPDIVCVLHV